MKFDFHEYPNVTVLVAGAQPVVQQHQPPVSSRDEAGQKSQVFDPYQISKEFPDRWFAYIRANYRNWRHVQKTFCCSERQARKYWAKPTGVNADKVAIAKKKHPVQAERMLFAAE